MDNSKECVLKAIEFRNPQRIPKGYEILNSHLMGEGAMDFSEKYGNDIMSVHYDKKDKKVSARKIIDEWGCVWDTLTSTVGEVREYPLENWDDLDKLYIPDYDEIERYNHAKEIIKENPDKFIVGGMGYFIFEQMHHLRGLVPLMEDLYFEEENVEKLISILVEQNLKIVGIYGNIGCDAIVIWDDWGLQDRLMISPALWRKFFKPAYKEIIIEAHKHNMKVMFHSCGYVLDIIDDLIEIGVNVFQFDQQLQIGIDILSKKCGGKVCMYCPIDIQVVMPTGDFELINKTADDLYEAFGTYEGGFIAKLYPQPYDIGITQESITFACDAYERIEKNMREKMDG